MAPRYWKGASIAGALWTEQKAFEEFQHSLAGKLWKYTQGLDGVLMCASSGPQLTARQGQAIVRFHLQNQKFDTEC